MPPGIYVDAAVKPRIEASLGFRLSCVSYSCWDLAGVCREVTSVGVVLRDVRHVLCLTMSLRMVTVDLSCTIYVKTAILPVQGDI